MLSKIHDYLDKHPSHRWKIRLNCFIVIIVSSSCIAGHLTATPILYSAGLQLGMSALTAVCTLLLSTAILLVAREE